MAVENKTGTPEGGQPQANAATQNQPRKYAGKYDSLEDAVEKGYVGLEQQVGGLSEKVANLTRLLEVAVQPQDPVPTVGPSPTTGYGYDPYGRNTPPAQPQNAAVDFLMNPQAHLDQRENALLQKVGNIVSATVQNAMAVADFKLRHPDLVKHEPLVRTFMGNTDPRKPVAERLEDAAKAARAYISQNFQAPGNPAPQGEHYVEPPSGPVTRYAPGSPPPPPGNTTEEEQELVNYLNERNATKAQNMGVGYDPNSK